LITTTKTTCFLSSSQVLSTIISHRHDVLFVKSSQIN